MLRYLCAAMLALCLSGCSVGGRPVLNQANAPRIAVVVNAVADSGIHELLKGSKDKDADVIARAISGTVDTVLLPVINGEQIVYSEAIRVLLMNTVKNSDKLPSLAKTGIIALGLTLDLYLPVPVDDSGNPVNVELSREQRIVIAAFLQGLRDGSKRYLEGREVGMEKKRLALSAKRSGTPKANWIKMK